jgi:outer membrane receptor protein involved in Fe transport
MQFRSRTVIVLAALLAFAVLPVVPVYAQTSNGVIAGVIVDNSGAVVLKATVEATSTERGGAPHVAETDSSGAYRIESLLPGTYSLVVKKDGFAEIKVSGLEVKASLTTTFNGTLELAGQTTSILVEASNGQELQTQSGDLSASLSSSEVHDLPIFGLNPIALVLTEPGVQDPGTGRGLSNGVNFSVNGNRPRSNNFLIDGQDNNDNSIAGQAFQPSNLEAISEVTILTNSYSAEYGRGGGSVTNVIYKGGSNNFHGSAWELANNSALATAKHEDLFAGCETTTPPSCHPVSVENTFGFAFGGPIVRNKLFVFGSSQWDRTRSTNNGNPITAPTANGVAELQALGSPNANFLLAAFAGLVAQKPSGKPIALGSATPATSTTPASPDRGSVEFGIVQRNGIAEVQNDRQWDVRVDFIASERDTLTARYYRDDNSLTPDLFNFPNSLAPFDSQQGGPSQSAAAFWTHTISTKAVNELRVSYTNINFTFAPTAATLANPLYSSPAITINGMGGGGGVFPTLGFPTALPQGRGHKSYQYQDAASFTLGRHTFKGGVDVNHLSVVDQIPFNSRGAITFADSSGQSSAAQIAAGMGTCGAMDCTSLANFVDNFTGASGTIAKVFGNPTLQPFVTTYAPYIQDTWRLRENLTVDLGLRYEYYGTPENVLSFPALNTTAGIGLPGVGLSSFPSIYANPQPSDRNNFGPRAGFAYTPHFAPRLFGQEKTVIRGGFGIFYDGLFTNILDNTGAAIPNAVGGTIVGGTGRGAANATGQLNAVAPLLNPKGGISTISNHLVSPKTLQWNLNIQRELPHGFVFTAAYVGTRGIDLFVNQEYNPKINFGARLNPNFGPITVRTNGGDSIYHAGQFTIDRKFSHGLLLRGAYTYSKLIDDGSEVFTITNGGAGSSFAQNPFSQAAERGLSAYDRRQRLVATYIWDVPYVHNTDNLGFRALNAITSHWQWSGFATFESGRPDTIISGSDTLGDGRATNDRPNVVNPNLPAGDIARYAKAPKGSAGNLGRNTYIGPNEQYWDMSIQRVIPFGFHHLETQALTVRAEFFDALNHANHDLPVLNLSHGPSTVNGDGGFGDLGSTIHGQRQIKIYVKYSF